MLRSRLLIILFMPDEFHTRESGAVETLCREATEGSTEALTRLLATYHARLLDHTTRKVGPDWRGRIDPEDVLQEAYFEVFEGIRSFRYQGVDSFYHWAAHIVDRRYIDEVRHHRAQKRDISRETPAAPLDPNRSTYCSLLEQCLRDSRTPSRVAGTAEAVSRAMSGLARLPEDYREVLRRAYLKDESFHTIAAEMGRTEDAVRRLAGRALERLRDLLEGDSPKKD